MPSENSLAFQAGVNSTKQALRAWRDHPLRALAPCLGGALAVALVLLVVVDLIGSYSPPDRDLALGYPPVSYGGISYVFTILGHNLQVLALHALACVAGFIAGVSLEREAPRRRGIERWAHEQGAKLAIGFVVVATVFSLTLQAISLGTAVSSTAAELHTSATLLLATLLPHALPELTALFLPLAAWLVASRRGHWERLLADSMVTTVIALPILVAAALWESLGAHLVVALVSHHPA